VEPNETREMRRSDCELSSGDSLALLTPPLLARLLLVVRGLCGSRAGDPLLTVLPLAGRCCVLALGTGDGLLACAPPADGGRAATAAMAGEELDMEGET